MMNLANAAQMSMTAKEKDKERAAATKDSKERHAPGGDGSVRTADYRSVAL